MMATQDTLRNELLKQNGIARSTSSAIAEEILARDAARVRRLKRVTAVSWIVFLICVIAAACIEVIARPPQDYFAPVAVIGVQAALLIAVFLSIALYVRERTLTMHQLQARLASIEAYLKKMAEREGE
jgi:hypothetical protein